MLGEGAEAEAKQVLGHMPAAFYSLGHTTAGEERKRRGDFKNVYHLFMLYIPTNMMLNFLLGDGRPLRDLLKEEHVLI